MNTFTYTLTFISLNDDYDLTLSFCGDEDGFISIVNTIKYWIFGGSDVKDGVAYFMRSSDVFCENWENLTKHLEYLKCHKLKALPSWIRKLGDGTVFTVVTNRTVSRDENFAIRAKLEELQFGIPFEQTMEQIHELTCNLFSNYSVVAHDGHKRICIGETQKNLRKCRYCKRTQADGATFKKIGHTISEGLGNKAIITNNECDDCNEYFGHNIEPDFITYIDPLRVLFGVQGKEHKITKIKGENYEIESTSDFNKTFTIKIFEEPNLDDNKELRKLSLRHNGNIIPQNIYKCLVKYAFGIIPEDMIKHFDDTSKWLLGKIEYRQLPLVHIAYVNGYEPTPRIVLYLRTIDNPSLPFAIGEFHVINMVYVYIIPTFSEDEVKSSNKTEWNTVLDILKHRNSLNWRWKDLSSLNPLEAIMNFDLKKNN